MQRSNRNCRRFTKSTLEVIEEEKVLEIDLGLKETEEKSTVKKMSTNFTPFKSSWDSNSPNFTEMHQHTRHMNRIMREKIEFVKRGIDKFLEERNSENEAKEFKIRNLEKEYEDLKHLLSDTFVKYKFEKKNHEQTRTDSQFMLEAQKEKFEKREKELLEQLEKYMTKSTIHAEISKTNDSTSSFENTFEYEELSEKLNSFQKQNESLQNKKNELQIENDKLKHELAELKKSYSNLKIQCCELNQGHPELGPIKTVENTIANPIESVQEKNSQISNDLKQTIKNAMNSTDSDKIITRKIYIEIDTTEPHTNCISELSNECHKTENIIGNSIDDHQNIMRLREKFIRTLEKLEKLQKDKGFSIFRYCESTNSNEEKEQIKIEKENENLKKYLEFLIDHQRNHLEKLTEIISNDKIKSTDNLLEHKNSTVVPLNEKNIKLKEENDILGVDIRIKKFKDSLAEKIIELKNMILNLKQENYNLKEKSSNIKTGVNQMKTEVVEHKDKYTNETFTKTREFFENILTSKTKIINEKNSLRLRQERTSKDDILLYNPQGAIYANEEKTPDMKSNDGNETICETNINSENKDTTPSQVIETVPKNNFVKEEKWRNTNFENYYNKTQLIKYWESKKNSDNINFFEFVKPTENQKLKSSNPEQKPNDEYYSESRRKKHSVSEKENISFENTTADKYHRKNMCSSKAEARRDKWKMSRTREHDSRRNINLNCLNS